MKLKRMRIENFRSFKDETINFDDYTCLVGPNGAGKSNILTALNVFFRNNASTVTNVQILSDEDFHYKNIKSPIRITVTFVDLSEEAQHDLKHYYRQGELTIFAEAIWDDANQYAEVKQYGARLVMEEFTPFFELNNSGAKVSELKDKYNEMRKAVPDLLAPGSKQAMIDALRDYEEKHFERCKLTPGSNQFYGWSKGANLLRKYIQWVYIPAVKDATTEQDEGSKTALGQLLERTIRTKVDFKKPIADLKGKLEKGYKEIIDKQQNALSKIETSIQRRLRDWASPSAILSLNWRYDPEKSLTVNEPIARAAIGEDNFIGEVARIGHGMQRAFIVSILQELAANDPEGGTPTLLLGFEEPELYQHPPQAQHMATLLEDLSARPERNTEVIVSTHHPYFVSSKGFENIRAVRKKAEGHFSIVQSTTYEKLEQRLTEALGEKPTSPSSVMARIAQIMQPSQKELFFTQVAILVEGIEDIAYISTQLQLNDKLIEFRKYGCHFIVADGKTSLSRPLAIAKELNIPSFVVFDSDAHENNEKERKEHEKDNSCILKLCGLNKFDPLPSETLWSENVIMWKSTITKIVPEDFGDGVWEKAENTIRNTLGFSDSIKRKNNLLIAATLENLAKQGQTSPILEKACNHILAFAKKSRGNREI